MPDFLASEVSVEWKPPQISPIVGGRTAIIGMVGTAKMGPVGNQSEGPVTCASWEEFIKIFGGHDANSTLALQAYLMWKQHTGALLKVVRTVHYTDVSNPATKTSVQAQIDINSVAIAATSGSETGSIAGHTFDDGGTLTRAWKLAHGDAASVDIDATGAGPIAITATAASLTGGATALPVTIGHTVTFTCDSVPGSQTVTYSAAHASAAEVAADINAQVSGFKAIVVGVWPGATVDFESDTKGSDSAISITGETGTGAADIGHPGPFPLVGAGAGGNVGNVDNVTWQELQGLIVAAALAPCTVSLAATNGLTVTSSSTGLTSSVQMGGVAITKLGFDGALHSGSATSSVPTLRIKGKWDGTYAHDLRAVVAAATNGETAYFNLSVTDDAGIVLEVFPNLQIATLTAADYVETAVNADPASGGSRYIEAEDLLTALRPANGSSTPAGGNDGLVGIVDVDFIGDAAGVTGLHVFDRAAVNLLVDGGRATAAWQNALASYCEVDREGRCFCLLDPPAGLSYSQMVTWKKTTAALASPNAAICWPRVKFLNPTEDAYTSDSKGLITVAPSGAWAGICSRNDVHIEGGVHTEPAGFDAAGNNGIVYDAVELENKDVTDIRVRKIIFPEGINPISQEEGTRIFFDGEYVTDRTASWNTIGQRRGVIYMVQTMKDGVGFARHKNINEDLFSRVDRSLRAFLKRQMSIGAFASRNEAEAFTLQCDEINNPASTRRLYRLYINVGFAKATPGIFVNLVVTEFLGALEAELAA